MTRIFTFLVLILSAGTVAGQESPRKYGYTFQWENDLYAFKDSTDRWYTNGLRYSMTYDTRDDKVVGEPDPGGKKMEPYRDLLTFLTDWYCQPRCTGRGWSFGHNFYTPSIITIDTPQLNDRPWAGWAYVGSHAQVADETSMKSIEVDIGAIGPVVRAGELQKWWHDVIGSKREPIGWHHQLRNEPAFVVDLQRRDKWGGSSFDLVTHYGGNLGTVQTSAYGGATVRAGHGIRGFGATPIRPTNQNLVLTRAEGFDKATVTPCPVFGSYWCRIAEWYLFAGFEVRAVAQNIFLDGNFFRDSPHSVDKRKVVPEWNWGFSIRSYDNRRLSYVRIKRGREFDVPNHLGPKEQTYGALIFSAEY